MKSDAYYLARIDAINQYYPDYDDQTKKWLQNGYIDDSVKADFETKIKQLEPQYTNSTLDFVAKCTYSTWFDMYPNKVAGKMVGNTSIYFPVSVKGTIDDCKTMFSKAINKKTDIEMMKIKMKMSKTRMRLLNYKTI